MTRASATTTVLQLESTPQGHKRVVFGSFASLNSFASCVFGFVLVVGCLFITAVCGTVDFLLEARLFTKASSAT